MSLPHRSLQTTRTWHWQLLALSLFVIAASLALEVRPDQRVALRGLAGYPLPPSCLSRSVFDVSCPGCGLTRSFVHLAHGDWRASWNVHPVGWVLAAVVLFQIPYRVVGLAGGGRLVLSERLVQASAAGLAILLLANWGWQLLSH